MPRPKITPKQTLFIEYYNGNASEAARLAGYKGNMDTLKQVGSENLAKPYIMAEIKKRENKKINKAIATREQRQQFWSDIMNTRKEPILARLRASELLGKSEADFTDVQQQTITATLTTLTRQEYKKKKKDFDDEC